MPKQPQALIQMPPAVRSALVAMGEQLGVARKRRKQSLRVWAQRIGVSEPTLVRLERGDASVAMGIYATALWLIGRSAMLAELAAPEHDLGALEDEVRAAKARAVRAPVSLSARLAAGLAATEDADRKKPATGAPAIAAKTARRRP